MAEVEELIIHARLIDQVSRRLERIDRKLDSTGDHTGRLGKRFRRTADDSDRLGASMQGLIRRLAGFNKLVVRWPAIVGAVVTAFRLLATALSSLTAVATQAVGALMPLGGLLAGLPGLIAGVVSIMGVLKFAFHGVGDAVEALQSGEIEKIAEAMSQLGAPGRGMALAVDALLDRVKILRREVQALLLPAFTRALGALNERLFPIFAGGMRDVARVLSGVVDQAAGMFASAGWARDLRTIFAGNARLVGQLGRGLLALADAMRHVMVAAGPLVDFLGGAFERFGIMVRDHFARGRASGALAAYFDRTRRAVESFMTILGNVWGALRNTFAVGREVQLGFVTGLVTLTERWEQWTASLAGRNALRDWFEDGRELLQALGRVGRALWDLFRRFDDDDSALVRTLDRISAPDGLIAAFGDLADKVGDDLGPLLVDLVTAFVRFNAVIPFSPLIELGKALLVIVNRLADLLEANPDFAEFLGMVITAGISLGVLSTALGFVLSPMTLLGGALAAAAWGLKWLYDNSETFRNFVDTAFKTTMGWFQGFWEDLPGHIDATRERLGEIGDSIREFVGRFTEGFGGREGILSQFERMRDLWNNDIKPLIDSVVNSVREFFGDEQRQREWGDRMERIGETVRSFSDAVIHLAEAVLPIVSAWWERSGRELFTTLGDAIGNVVDFVLDLVNAFASLLETFASLLQGDIPGAIEAFNEFGGHLAQAVIDGFQAVIELLVGVLMSQLGLSLESVKRGLAGWLADVLEWLNRFIPNQFDFDTSGLRDAAGRETHRVGYLGQGPSDALRYGPGYVTFPTSPDVLERRSGRGDPFAAGDVTPALTQTLRVHALVDSMTPGSRTITNATLGGFPGSAHPRGFALDTQGSFLNAYAKNLEKLGGYAAFHGAGARRHLHGVYGDTAQSRPRGMPTAPTAAAGRGDVSVQLVFPAATDRAQIEQAVYNVVRRLRRDELERS